MNGQFSMPLQMLVLFTFAWLALSRYTFLNYVFMTLTSMIDLLSSISNMNAIQSMDDTIIIINCTSMK